MHYSPLSLLAATAALAGAAQAADVVATLPIDKVTVYAGSAQVTRAGAVNLPAGAQRIVVHGLPAGIDTSLLQISVGSEAVRVGSVESAVVNATEYVGARERELRDRLEQKSDQRAAIQDEIDSAQTQLKLLDSLAANPTGGSLAGPAVNGANLATVLGTVGTSASSARARIRDARLRQRGVDRELEQLKAELAKVATAKKSTLDVSVNVEVSAAGTAPVAIAYRVPDAGWDWVYQARLDTNTKQLELQRQGRVQQGSGEDWSNVALTLTTADPQGDASTPTLGPLFLDLRNPVVLRSMTMAAPAMAPAPAVMAKAADADSVGEAVVTRRNNATAAATQYLVEYQVPGRTTLAADRQPRLYPIASDHFAAELVARVVPNQSRRAYLEAKFKYQQENPIEAGELQLYRDGAFVGSAGTAAFLPGADVRMPFGVDERIKVEVHDEAAKSDQSPLIGKQISRETRQRFDITSYHAATLPVEVVDRLPVSRNDDIKVETLKGATDPAERSLDGRSGVLLWKLDAEPRKTASIRQYYVVHYPRDRVLEESAE